VFRIETRFVIGGFFGLAMSLAGLLVLPAGGCIPFLPNGSSVADNRSSWYISGAPDSRWSDENLHSLAEVKGRDFEVVYTGEAVTE
jgi:hypothetical protein